MKELSGMVEMFYFLFGVEVIQVYTLVKSHHTVNLKSVHFICVFYLSAFYYPNLLFFRVVGRKG